MRETLEQAYERVGRQTDGLRVRCKCNRLFPPAAMYDVSDVEEVEGAYRCGICVSDYDRQQIAAEEEKLRNTITEEKLNDLRAVRDQLLFKSDWTQLADNRERIGSEASSTWDSWRAQVRQVVVDAKNGTITEFPPIPE